MGDLDRRKHDVDIIERVLGGIRDTDRRARVVDVELEVPSSGGSSHQTLEVMVGIEDSDHKRPKG